MSKIKWDAVGQKLYEVGVDHGVLYPQINGEYPKGVPWNGLTNVTEKPSGAEETKLYADNIPYMSLRSVEEYGLTIECYFYPDEWGACNGETEMANGVILGQQRRNSFGFSYRSKVGNDTDGEDFGFRIHLVYGGTTTPSERTHETVNESPNASTFSFEVSTIPVDVSGVDATGKPFKPVSCITIDSRKAPMELIRRLEEVLYGTDGDDENDGTDGRLPFPDELKEMFSETAGFKI